MAYSFLVGASAGGTGSSNAVTTSAIDTSGADLLILAVAAFGADPVVGNVSDSKGNSWNRLNVYKNVSQDDLICIFWSRPSSVGTGHTFTFTPGSTFPSISVGAFSGSDATPFDVQNGTTGGTSDTVQPGSITPSQNDSLAVTAICADGSQTINSINDSYNIVSTTQWSSGQHVGVSLAYKIQTTAVATNPTWTLAGIGTFNTATIAAFQPSVVSGTPFFMQLGAQRI